MLHSSTFTTKPRGLSPHPGELEQKDCIVPNVDNLPTYDFLPRKLEVGRFHHTNLRNGEELTILEKNIRNSSFFFGGGGYIGMCM